MKAPGFDDLDFSNYPQASFTAGEIIFAEGDAADCAYVIESGMVEIFGNNLKGQPTTLALLREGSMFGELALIEDLPRSASAKALGAVSCRVVSRAAFEDLMAGVNPMARRVISLVIHSLYRSTNVVLASGS